MSINGTHNEYRNYLINEIIIIKNIDRYIKHLYQSISQNVDSVLGFSLIGVTCKPALSYE